MFEATSTLSLLALLFGLGLGYAAIRYRVEGDPLVDQVDAILPQTQCGQCDFPGCRPYAEAIAKGEAEINQCPPGGQEGVEALAELLNIGASNSFLQSAVYGFGAAVGFSFVLILFAGIRERVESADVPEIFQGIPIALITAGLMSMAFMGFVGLANV